MLVLTSIMTEFETVIIKPLINSGKIVFYKRYVDDTLVLAKPFDSQIQFTVDKFPDNDIHFQTFKYFRTVPLSTANQPILVNTNFTQAILHGQERFLGYVPSLIVPTKFAATMNSSNLN